MRKEIENNLEAILETLKDHMLCDKDMQCVEAVKELLEEFYDIEVSHSDSLELFYMVIGRTMKDGVVLTFQEYIDGVLKLYGVNSMFIDLGYIDNNTDALMAYEKNNDIIDMIEEMYIEILNDSNKRNIEYAKEKLSKLNLTESLTKAVYLFVVGQGQL